MRNLYIEVVLVVVVVVAVIVVEVVQTLILFLLLLLLILLLLLQCINFAIRYSPGRKGKWRRGEGELCARNKNVVCMLKLKNLQF